MNKDKLIKIAQVFDKGGIEVVKYLAELEDKIDEVTPSIKELLKKIKGDKGDTPTKQELVDLITPLIPPTIDGHTPTEKELLSLITPLIPKVKDGKTPTKTELLAIIKPLIPKISSKDISQEVYGKLSEEIKDLIPTREDIEKGIEDNITKNLPKFGKEFRDGLELLKEDERVDFSAIKGFEKTQQGILDRAVSIVDNRTSFLINKVSNLSEKVANAGNSEVANSSMSTGVFNEAPTGAINSTNNVYTLSQDFISGKTRVYLNGLRQTLTTDYTETGDNQITFVDAPITGDILYVDYDIAVDSTAIFNEIPSGLVNSTNTIFTSANPIVTGSSRLFLNGIRQDLGVDYTESGASEITFTTSPITGDVVLLDYQT